MIMKRLNCLYFTSIAFIVIGAVFLYRKPIYIVVKQDPLNVNVSSRPTLNSNLNKTNLPYTRRIMSGIPRDYALVGYLKNEETIFPLYGRASRTNSHRWNYHTTTDRLSNIPLPIKSVGRNCTLDLGCDELYDGQIVSIPGLLGSFGVHVYPKDFTH
jgi:hypothetical protein